MAENSQEALNELLQRLRSNNASALADEITRVVARGITEEKEIYGRVKELSQRPLTSDEAYKIAIEMLIASLEPAIMKEHALREIEKLMGMRSSVVWAQDFVEKSPVAPESSEVVSFPDIIGLDALEVDLKNLVGFIGNV